MRSGQPPGLPFETVIFQNSLSMRISPLPHTHTVGLGGCLQSFIRSRIYQLFTEHLLCTSQALGKAAVKENKRTPPPRTIIYTLLKFTL